MVSKQTVERMFSTGPDCVPGASLVREALLAIEVPGKTSADEVIEALRTEISRTLPDSAPEEFRSDFQHCLLSARLTSELSSSLQSLMREHRGRFRQSTVFAVTRFVAENEMLLALLGRLAGQVQVGVLTGRPLAAQLDAAKLCSQQARESGLSLAALVAGAEPEGPGASLLEEFSAKISAYYRALEGKVSPVTICEQIGIN